MALTPNGGAAEHGRDGSGERLPAWLASCRLPRVARLATPGVVVAGPNTGFTIGAPIGLLSWPSTRRMLKLGTGWRAAFVASRRRRLLEPGSMPPAATYMRKSGADGCGLS